jgi:hypothetical protein
MKHTKVKAVIKQHNNDSEVNAKGWVRTLETINL